MTRLNTRRLAPILLVLSLLVPAAALAAPVSRSVALSASDPTQTPVGHWNGALLGGLDIPTFSGTNAGPRLAGEALYGLGPIADKLTLDIGPRAAFTYNGGDASLWTLDALGIARLNYLAAPKLSFYGEAGLGLGYYHTSYTDAFSGFSTSDSGLMVDLLFAPGVIYAISPSVNLLGEVGFWVNAKSGMGLRLVVPTIGIQWVL